MSAPEAYVAENAGVDPRFGSVDCVFFVIGAQKAGTTWLSRYFLEHPNVSVPYWKEHNYWNMVQGRPDPGRMLLAQKARRETEGLLRKAAATVPFTRHAKRQRAITLALKATEAPFPPYSAYADVILENATDRTGAAGELCPQYARLEPETYAKMSGLNSNTRFMFLMRDPVSRTISGAQHSLRKTEPTGKITSETLSMHLTRIVDGIRSGAEPNSRYDRTIERLEQAVDLDNIAYVFFEDLFNQSQVERICMFLGVPFVPGNIEKKRNIAGKSAVTVSKEDRAAIAAALKPVYDFAINRFGSTLPEKWLKSAALC